jgi:DNA-directed RNA polymerase subunit L
VSLRFEEFAEQPVIAGKHDGVNNYYPFTIQQEDDTLGNLLAQRQFAIQHKDDTRFAQNQTNVD